MNIQTKGALDHPGRVKFTNIPSRPSAIAGNTPAIQFGGDKFSDEIKDSKGLVKEKGKGLGLFSYIFSQGTFPLKLISSISLELDPAKREKIKAYNELIEVGLRPSSNALDGERKLLEEQLHGMIERNVAPRELAAWFDKGQAPLASLKGERSLALMHAAQAGGASAAVSVGDRATMGLHAAEAWVKDSKDVLSNVKDPSPALGVWVKDAKRFMNRMNTWLESEKKAHQLLDNPTPKLKEWMDTLKLNADQLRTPVLDANQIDREAYVPSETLVRMKELGLFKLKVPTEYGGLDLHQKEYHRVIKTLPPISGTLGALISAHSTIGSAPLVLNGTKAQQEEYLPKIAEGNFLAAFGLTEPGAGTDTKKLKTTASLSPDGKEWIINGESGEFGEKLYITNTHRSGLMFLMTKTDLGQNFGTPGENAMIAKWAHSQKKGKAAKGAEAKLDFEALKKQHPDKPWMKLSNKMLKESIMILDLPFRITDTPEQRAEKMKDLADKGMVIAEPLDLMMIRGSNQAFIRFNNFRVPVNKVLGGVGEDLDPLHKLLKEHADKPEVPGLDWRKMTLNGKPLKLDGAGQGMNDVFNALNKGRAGFGPSYASAVKAMLDQSKKHAVQREMFDLYGGTQDKMPVIKKYLGEMAMKSAALDAVSELTSALIEEKGDKMNIIDICAAVKVISTEWNWESAQLAMRIFGGNGTRRGADNGMERNFRDAWIGLIVEGVNEAMKQVVVGVGATPAMESLQNVMKGKITKADLKNLVKGPLPSRITASFGLPIPGLKNITLLSLREKGDLDRADAAWIQSRTAQLYRRSTAWGAKYGPKMMGRQNELIRLSDISLDLFAMAAVMLKLKKTPDLPKEEKVSLQEFINVTKRRIDKNLKEFSHVRENPEDKSARIAADAHFDAERILLGAAKMVEPKG